MAGNKLDAALHFNTGISQLMVFINAAYKVDQIPYEYIEGFVKLLATVSPHMMEEIWQIMGETESLSYAAWPTFDPAKLIDDVVEIMIQVNGKLRGKIEVELDSPKDEVEKLALANHHVHEFLADTPVKKVIVIPNKIVNIVI